MKKILCGGGLGDAALIYSQLYQMGLNKNEFELTHCMINLKLKQSIEEFYLSQNIKCEIKKIDNHKWYDKHKKEYDLHIRTLNKKNICTFPEFNVNSVDNFDVLISPYAGRDNNRNIPFKEINNYIKKNEKLKIVLVGRGHGKINDLKNVTNFINKTTISELLNLIFSSNKIISPGGFVAIVGGLMGKRVLTKEPRKITQSNYYLPEWNNKFITNLT